MGILSQDQEKVRSVIGQGLEKGGIGCHLWLKRIEKQYCRIYRRVT